MEPKERKSIAILADTHRKISLESVHTGKGMYELMAEAWELYERQGRPENVVPMPATSKRNPNSVTITVPPEIAKDVQRIVDVLRAPGAMEHFNLLMKALAEDTMGELARSLTTDGKKQNRR